MLLLALLAACKQDPLPATTFDPVLTEHDSLVLWQGFTHEWTYNHRWGRLGSGFVYVGPTIEPASYPLDLDDPLVTLPTEAGWTYMGSAGAGTGKDNGVHQAWGQLLEGSAALHLASATAAVRVEGDEGVVTTKTLSLDLPLPAGLSGADTTTVLLNGVWLHAAGVEAKQPFHFAVHAGEGEVHDGSLRVDVTVELGLDCDTPECAGCAARPTVARDVAFAYDVYVALAVIAGDIGVEEPAPEAFTQTWDGPHHSGSDDSCLVESDLFPTCQDYWLDCGDATLVDFDELDTATLPRALDLPAVPGFDAGTVGLRGVTLDLDHPHHMVGISMGVTPLGWADPVPAVGGLWFKNWRRWMNLDGQDWDVLSATAFGTAGTFAGSLDLAVVGLPAAPSDTISVHEEILTEASQQVLVADLTP